MSLRKARETKARECETCATMQLLLEYVCSCERVCEESFDRLCNAQVRKTKQRHNNEGQTTRGSSLPVQGCARLLARRGRKDRGRPAQALAVKREPWWFLCSKMLLNKLWCDADEVTPFPVLDEVHGLQG